MAVTTKGKGNDKSLARAVKHKEGREGSWQDFYSRSLESRRQESVFQVRRPAGDYGEEGE